METGIELITKERTRQIEVEGWDSEHDDKHGLRPCPVFVGQNIANNVLQINAVLTEGLAKDGNALDGFTDALKIQEKWQQIKLKRSTEMFSRKLKIQ